LRIKWIVLIIGILIVLSILFIILRPDKNKTLALDIDRIEKIEASYYYIFNEITDRTQISNWVDLFNSLSITYQKDGLPTCNRPPSKFAIYYTNGKVDIITFVYTDLYYNGDFYHINNHEDKTEIHDKLLGLR